MDFLRISAAELPQKQKNETVVHKCMESTVKKFHKLYPKRGDKICLYMNSNFSYSGRTVYVFE
jgi:hypothetical protein